MSGASGRVSQQQIVTSLQQLNNIEHSAVLGSTGADLQRTVEERQVAITENVIASSEELIDDLTELDKQVSALSLICERIEASVHVARSAALPMLAERDRLLSEQEKTNTQAKVLGAFNALFSVSDEEMDALSHTVSPAFFRALQRVQAVHANCRMLLRSNHRRAGLELMDRMSNLQEKAYENLCRWVQSECNASAGGAGESSASALLKQAIDALKSRPVLLKYCAEEVASARHNVFFRSFLDALTKTTGVGAPSIEHYMTSQPVTYVGKIFAWLATNVKKERELFSNLFTFAKGEGPDLGSEAGGSGVQALLDRVFEGICRPLRVRLEQVLTSSSASGPKIVDTYRICQVLEEGRESLGQVIGIKAALTATVRECAESAATKFGEEMKQRYGKLLSSSAATKPVASASSLAPPEAFLAEIKILASILASPPQERERRMSSSSGRLEEVLGQSIKLLCEYCDTSAKHVMKAESEGFFLNEPSPQVFPRGSRQMYLVNCLQLLLGTLQEGKGKEAKAKGNIDAYVEAKIEANLESLVSIIVKGIMAERKLTEKMERIAMYEESSESASIGAMARDPALSMDDLKATLSDIHTYMLQWLGGQQELASLKLLQDQDTQVDAQNRVFHSLSGAYDKIYSVLADPANHYPVAAVKSIQHSPEYIKDLIKTL